MTSASRLRSEQVGFLEPIRAPGCEMKGTGRGCGLEKSAGARTTLVDVQLKEWIMDMALH